MLQRLDIWLEAPGEPEVLDPVEEAIRSHPSITVTKAGPRRANAGNSCRSLMMEVEAPTAKDAIQLVAQIAGAANLPELTIQPFVY